MINRNFLLISIGLAFMGIMPRVIKSARLDYSLLLFYFFYISICFSIYYIINKAIWQSKPLLNYYLKFSLGLICGLASLAFIHFSLQIHCFDCLLYFFNLRDITPSEVLAITIFRSFILQSLTFVCLFILESKNEKVKLQSNIEQLNQYLDDLRNHRIQEKEYRNTILLRFQDQVLPIEINEIAFFHLEEGIVFLYLLSGKKYFQNSSLENLEKELNPLFFFRANRQFLINRKAIEKIEQIEHRKLRVILTQATNEDVIISKVKAPVFLRWLEA
jgi:hypothetical protein